MTKRTYGIIVTRPGETIGTVITAPSLRRIREKARDYKSRGFKVSKPARVP